MGRGRRVFFAAWPGAGVRDELVGVQAAVEAPRARVVAADSLHLTLAFLGSVDDEGLRRLDEGAAAMAFGGVGVVFDRWWIGPGGTLALEAAEVPDELAVLARALGRLAGGRARRFRPHVTLFRKLGALHLPDMPPRIAMRVAGFALVQSCPHPDGSRYRTLREYPPATG